MSENTKEQEVAVEKNEAVATKVGQEALTFLKENITENEDGKFSLSMKKYFEFMNRNGISEQVLRKKDEVDNELIGGLYLFNNEKLVEKVNKAKDDGKLDEGGFINSVSVNIPSGSIKLKTEASRKFNVPSRPGEESNDENNTTIRFNYSTLTVKQNRHLNFDAETVKACEDHMKNLFGL